LSENEEEVEKLNVKEQVKKCLLPENNLDNRTLFTIEEETEEEIA
jgi:hypothetical protein